jgi:DNA-3-methyladenine glycosylase I
MTAYHDTEWGVPTHDDRRHFEFLILEGAQAGLSWKTILDKRAGYRRNFAGFDPSKVARFTPAKLAKILEDPGIVRNRAKVESTVANAKAFLQVQKDYGSFDKFLWEFVGGKPVVNKWREMSQVPPRSDASDAVAKELKRRGFKFAGTTIMYAHMQACGLINDHLTSCFRYKQV